jgi:3-hydroxyacyl-CoA dehydrogenase
MPASSETKTIHFSDAVSGFVDYGLLQVTISNPPVNAISAAIREGLMQVMDMVETYSVVHGLIIRGEGKFFAAGADIREFDLPPSEPTLPQVTARIEALAKPVIAVINGPALGGGCEIVLACHYRIASETAKFGLPEVKLGLVPGAGGTQRLPRLTGLTAALDMIGTGRTISAQEALKNGLIDEVVTSENLRLTAQNVAKKLIDTELRRTLDLSVKAENTEQTAAKILSKARGRVAPSEALRLVSLSATLPAQQALAEERATFLHLRESDEGYQCITALLDKQFQAGRLSEQALQQQKANLRVSADITDLSVADLVIEAIFDDLAVKSELFVKLDKVLRPDAIVATNTSYLNPDELAVQISHPSRVVGMHFFSPAHIMRLLEIVNCAQTAPDVLATTVSVAKKLNKLGIVCGVCEGFIGNRIFSAYRREAEFMLEQGALPHEIDAALEDYGFAMGLFAVYDMAGLEIAWAKRKRQAATRSPDEPYSPIADRLCEAGRFGQKSGKGWYQYQDGKRQIDPEVTTLIETVRLEKKFQARSFTSEQIITQLLQVMADEGTQLLQEGIAASPSDIDLVLINGYGFPAHKGGPMFAATQSKTKATGTSA